MPLLHIHANDRTAGNVSTAVITLSEVVSKFKIISHIIPDGPIPWIWPAVGDVVFSDGADSIAVDLSAGSTQFNSDTTYVANLIQTEIQNNCDGSLGVPDFSGSTVVYNSQLNTYDITFQDGIGPVVGNILWSDALSTGSVVFNRIADESTTASVISLEATNIGRPYYMLVDIAETINHCVNSSGISTPLYHTTVIHTSDVNFSEDIIDCVPYTDTLTFAWYRDNIPDSICPFTLAWQIVAECDVPAQF